MKTIKDVLEDSIKLLRTEVPENHIKAITQCYVKLSLVKGFNPDVIDLLGMYRSYIADWYFAKNGLMEKINSKLSAFKKKGLVKELLRKCEGQAFGDGDAYIQEILALIKNNL